MKKSKNKNQISETDLLTYGKYLLVGTFLQHSNRIQLRYKMTTFTWFIATFIGVGYSLSDMEINLPFHPLLISAVLCLASLFVIGIIWYLDIIVQEKNIASAVHQGLSLEEKNSWLPKIYQNIVRMHYLLGYVSMKSVFYMGCAAILCLTMCYTVTSYLLLTNFRFWPLSIIALLIGVPVLFYFSFFVTKSNDPYVILNKLKRVKRTHGN